MNDYNFVNDPVNPNYIIVVKLNAVDENFANVKKNIVKNNINKEFYTKLSGEVIYLWEHLRPIVSEIKTKLDKKLKKDGIKEDYESDNLIKVLDSDDDPEDSIDLQEDIIGDLGSVQAILQCKMKMLPTEAVMELFNIYVKKLKCC
jgi:hypothetical protein